MTTCDFRQAVQPGADLPSHFKRQFEPMIVVEIGERKLQGLPLSEVPDLEVHEQRTRFLGLDSTDFIQTSTSQ